MAQPQRQVAAGALSRFRRTYLVALGLVAALAILGQVVVQRGLAAQLSSAEVINIAGRQRMLSQRLAKNALIALRTTGPEAGAARRELVADLATWQAAHERLTHGDLAHPDLAVVTPETRAKLDALEPAHMELATALQPLPSRRPSAAIERLLTAERRYLPLMDDLVFAYSRIAASRVAETRRIEGLLLGLTLLVLLLEALFVFRPMHGALSRAVARLRRSLAQLSDSEGRYARAMDGARDGFFDWNLNTHELELSTRFRALWSLPADCTVEWSDLVGRLAASDRPRLQAWIDEGASSAVDLEMRIQREDGWGWVRLRGASAGDGFVSGRLSDITDRRRLIAERDRLIAVQDAKLQDADEALQRTSAMNAVATLAGGLAHDFNNYLQVIGLEAEWLESQGNTEAADSLAAIRTSADEASRLAKQLLTLARGKVGTTLAAVELNTALREMQPLLERLVGDEITIDLDVPTELPSIDADLGQLRQLVVNLVGNARDAMPAGGQVGITLRSRGAGATAGVELAVTDEGCGMSDEVRRRVFDPFFTTKQPGKGTGLGLAMVHRIVESHRGRIFVESAQDQGTTVRAWFPARETTTKALDSGVNGPTPNLALLLVDDDPNIRTAVRRQLAACGHTVHVAASGEDALKVAETLPELDLLITDVMLPGLLGPEVADHVRRRFGAKLPVLFISGYAAEHVDLNAPGTRLLVKPFTAEELEAEVARQRPRRSLAAQ